MAENNKNGIYLTNVQLVRLMAACTIGAGLFFIVGYVKGKHTVNHERCTISAQKGQPHGATTYALRLDCEQEARALAHHVQQAGFEVELQPKISVDAGGKQMYWYQIITKNFTNQEELVKLVEHIRNQESLVGSVSYSEC